MTEAVLRPAIAADAAGIARVHVATWQAAYRDLLPAAFLAELDVGRRERGWSALIAAASGGVPGDDAPDGGAIEVATIDDRIIGFVSWGASRDDDLAPEACEVMAIYVDPERQGGGLGAALLDRAERGLWTAGRAPLVLWVLAGNMRARRFYEARGWQADGATRPIAIGDTTVDEVRYRRS